MNEQNKYEQIKFGEQKRKRSGEWVKCETCGRAFYVVPARVRHAAKQGTLIRFCSMKCYIKTGELNPFWGKHHSDKSKQLWLAHPNRSSFLPGAKNPNAKRFGADFVGTGTRWWKHYLMDSVGHCEKCGYVQYTEILVIHHIDGNRRHNKRDNLLLLCPNCHAIEHYVSDGGKRGGRPRLPLSS